ncbi:MAG: hypothetical protein J1E83_01990 [Lachnospiraceae bacterium]|nr:hypothetical protein [Lachnospiraceae bacterium]
MKKTKVFAGMCIASLLGITGCGATLPEMTQAQEDAIVEYVANIVMRHTNDYDSRLVDLSLYEDNGTEQDSSEETDKKEQGGMDPVADTPIVNAPSGETVGNIAQVLLPEGMSIRFTGYRTVDSYPDGDSSNPYFGLDASEGNKYLVMGFAMSNDTGTEQEVDIFSMAARFTVLINGTERRPALTTMLLDDLGTYVGSVGAGEEVELVLLAEIDSSLAGGISELRLSASAGGNSVVMPLE